MIRYLVPLALVAALGGSSTCTPQRASEPPPGGTGSSTASAAATEVQCVDGWLSSKELDEYGNPKGTMYMGGTPLFDEASGKTTDRLEYIYQNHPEAKAACHPEK